MNDQLQAHARKTLKEGLAQCSGGQQSVFKRMYAHGNMDQSIDEVIDNMEPEKLDWAMEQVRKTLEKKEKSHDQKPKT